MRVLNQKEANATLDPPFSSDPGVVWTSLPTAAPSSEHRVPTSSCPHSCAAALSRRRISPWPVRELVSGSGVSGFVRREPRNQGKDLVSWVVSNPLVKNNGGEDKLKLTVI